MESGSWDHATEEQDLVIRTVCGNALAIVGMSALVKPMQRRSFICLSSGAGKSRQAID